MKVAEIKIWAKGLLTLTKEKKIKNIEKIQTGQVWFVYPEQKSNDAVPVCIVDLRGEIALIVPLHNQKHLKTRIEPWVSLTYCHRLRFIAVVERTLPVSMAAFQPDCYLGEISAEQVSCIIQANKEFEEILSAKAELHNLESNGREDLVTDELINKAFKAFLLLPGCGSLEDVVNLHTKLQSVVQRYHEKLFFG